MIVAGDSCGLNDRRSVSGINQIWPWVREQAPYRLFRANGGRSLRRLRMRNGQCVLPATMQNIIEVSGP